MCARLSGQTIGKPILWLVNLICCISTRESNSKQDEIQSTSWVYMQVQLRITKASNVVLLTCFHAFYFLFLIGLQITNFAENKLFSLNLYSIWTSCEVLFDVGHGVEIKYVAITMMKITNLSINIDHQNWI